MSDLALGYIGASGGFLLLHLLLLSDRYHVEFHNNVCISTAINNQWNIDHHHNWKKTEHWPNNDATSLSTTPFNKIYFYCSPNNNEFSKNPVKKIALYTDIDSQLILSRYKNAYWFINGKTTDFIMNRQLLNNWNKHYHGIGDSSWPKCRSFRHIDKLPQQVQQELLSSSYTQSYIGCTNWQDYLVKNSTKKYRNTWVLDSAMNLISSADESILLQDLVNGRGEILVKKQLINSVNKKQQDLIDHWINLHDANILDQIGINR